ncbi:MAG: hypothetical protein BWX80_04252 [Candidatus Hydrogenedentes bacterium ADurb.Bin101]|nr:MAG: hypothetical protein BWX80_04252 [Candidatus Hydrogenedentes bacterium ADurb.Bin101]
MSLRNMYPCYRICKMMKRHGVHAPPSKKSLLRRDILGEFNKASLNFPNQLLGSPSFCIRSRRLYISDAVLVSPPS